ncbi:MAG TPA: phosphatase PAP2 family protein [Candidatus Acidoferrales bacterium]
MNKGADSTVKIGLTVLAVLGIGIFAFNHSFYDDALGNPFFAIELGSIAILLLRLRPQWSSVASIGVLTLVFSAIDFKVLHFHPYAMSWFSFLGLASFLVMLVRLVWEDSRRLLSYALATSFVFAASEYFATSFLEMTTKVYPKTLDVYLMMFDASLAHFQVSFALGRLYVAHAWLHNVTLIAYIGLAIPIMTVYAGQLARYGKKALASLTAFVITGPIGLVFYNIFPAAGPRQLFGIHFPFSPIPYSILPNVILEAVKVPGPRNDMPSLHLTWTLLAWWYSRGLSRTERIVAFAFLSLTAFATLGTGEHWLVDLVVAFPFALMIQAICAFQVPLKDIRRQTAFLFGLSTTFVWLILLRYCTRLFWTSPLVPWSLIAGTIGLTCIRQRILSSATIASVDLGARSTVAGREAGTSQELVEPATTA